MAGILRISGPGHGVLYENPEKAFGGADGTLVRQPSWKENSKGQEAGEYRGV